MSDLDLLADLVRLGNTAAELACLTKRRDYLKKEQASIAEEIAAIEAEIEECWQFMTAPGIKITRPAPAKRSKREKVAEPVVDMPDVLVPCNGCDCLYSPMVLRDCLCESCRRIKPLTDAAIAEAVDRAEEAKIAAGWEPPSEPVHFIGANYVMPPVSGCMCARCNLVLDDPGMACPKCGGRPGMPPPDPLDSDASPEPADPTDAELTAMGAVEEEIEEDFDDEKLEMECTRCGKRLKKKGDWYCPSCKKACEEKGLATGDYVPPKRTRHKADLPIPGPKPEPGPPMDLFVVRTGDRTNALFAIRCSGLKKARAYAKQMEPLGQSWVAYPDDGEVAKLGLNIRDITQPVAIGEVRIAR